MLSVAELRKILADSTEKGRFDENEPADASEAFMYIMDQVHETLKPKTLEGDSKCNCYSHRAVHTRIQKQILCRNCESEASLPP